MSSIYDTSKEEKEKRKKKIGKIKVKRFVKKL